MRRTWVRFQAWLRREEYTHALVAEVAKQAFIDGHKAGTDAAFKAGHQKGYEIGRAHGELIGRQELAKELDESFNADTGRDLTADDVKNVAARQLH